MQAERSFMICQSFQPYWSPFLYVLVGCLPFLPRSTRFDLTGHSLLYGSQHDSEVEEEHKTESSVAEMRVFLLLYTYKDDNETVDNANYFPYNFSSRVPNCSSREDDSMVKL